MDEGRVLSGAREDVLAPDQTDRSNRDSLARTVLSPGAVLFPVNDEDHLRARWREIQLGFVDQPRRAVEQANALVELVIQQLTDVFTRRAR
jgi:hypothetical protein